MKLMIATSIHHIYSGVDPFGSSRDCLYIYFPLDFALLDAAKRGDDKRPVSTSPVQLSRSHSNTRVIYDLSGLKTRGNEETCKSADVGDLPARPHRYIT